MIYFAIKDITISNVLVAIFKAIGKEKFLPAKQAPILKMYYKK